MLTTRFSVAHGLGCAVLAYDRAMAPKRIESTNNPWLKATARLKDRRGRQHSGRYLIEGLREVERAIAAGVAVEQLVVAPELVGEPDRVNELVHAAPANDIELFTLSSAAFARLSLRQNPDGVAAVAVSRRRSPASVPLPTDALVLVVVGLEKPGNLGALLRTADATGVDAVFLSGSGTDLENPNVIRASQGSLFAVPVATGTASELLSTLESAGLRLVATSPRATATIWEVDLTGGVALVLGAEHSGLPEEWLRAAHSELRIPMRSGLADSLNVSVAGAVVLYEALRQRSA